MQVELRIRGQAGRLAEGVFDGCTVRTEEADTVVCGAARDEVDALAMIDLARSVGLTVVGWRMIDEPAAENSAAARPR